MHSDSHCITNILIRLNLSFTFLMSARIQRSEWVGGSMKTVGLDYRISKDGRGGRVIQKVMEEMFKEGN